MLKKGATARQQWRVQNNRAADTYIAVARPAVKALLQKFPPLSRSATHSSSALLETALPLILL